MPRIDVYLNAQSAPSDALKNKAVLVIDVLRACSTIVTALDHGARAVIPVADMAEAGKIAAHIDPESTVMGGERSGVKIEGYHLGNSPAEYSREAVQGRTVVLNTSNGTGAITRARGAGSVAIGCFLNAAEAIRFISEAETDAVIICAGAGKRIGLEDVLCAGLILHELWRGSPPAQVSDASHIAFSQYLHDRERLPEAVARSNHGRALIELGFANDVARCSEVNSCLLLPVYRDSRLVLSDPSAATYPSRVPAADSEVD